RVWAREHADRPGGSDVRGFGKPGFPRITVPAIREVAIHLSKSGTAATGTLPPGSGDQGCAKRQRGRGEFAPAGAALRGRQVGVQFVDSGRSDRTRARETNRQRAIRAGFFEGEAAAGRRLYDR